MLSPTSLSALSVTSGWLRPVRAVSPQQGPSPGASQLAAPVSPTPLAMPGAGGLPDGASPSRSLPRGSLLDLSV